MMLCRGYVSSTDQSGNIYKTIYIQDDLQILPRFCTKCRCSKLPILNIHQGAKVYI